MIPAVRMPSGYGRHGRHSKQPQGYIVRTLPPRYKAFPGRARLVSNQRPLACEAFRTPFVEAFRACGGRFGAVRLARFGPLRADRAGVCPETPGSYALLVRSG